MGCNCGKTKPLGSQGSQQNRTSTAKPWYSPGKDQPKKFTDNESGQVFATRLEAEAAKRRKQR